MFDVNCGVGGRLMARKRGFFPFEWPQIHCVRLVTNMAVMELATKTVVEKLFVMVVLVVALMGMG